MIYSPKHFQVERTDLIHEIIERYNFATMICVRDRMPIISHLPFLFEPQKGKDGSLFAHMAKANPQWRSFRDDLEATVIFQGPHAYVSPRWYELQPDNVPTWNYAVVHAQGIPRVINDEGAAFEVLNGLVKRRDPEWTQSLLEKDRRDLLREIVVFEIGVRKLEVKFKVSQNRPALDRESVARNLLAGKTDMERETGALMMGLKNAR